MRSICLSLIIALMPLAGPAQAQSQDLDPALIAGTYRGSILGFVSGTMVFIIEEDGAFRTFGAAASQFGGGSFNASGTINPDGTFATIQGATLEFTGQVGLDGTITGIWSSPSENVAGDFFARR